MTSMRRTIKGSGMIAKTKGIKEGAKEERIQGIPWP